MLIRGEKMRLYNEERRKYILDKLEINKNINVSELSSELDVSEVTIRKDLDLLESKGLLKRVHGGAIKLKTLATKLSYSERTGQNIESKKAIAEKAATFLSDGLNIFLDAGTTTLELVNHIVKYKDITVVTYDLEIAVSLGRYDHIKTIILGGTVEHETLCSLSTQTYAFLEKLRADIAFMACDAYDKDGAYCSTDIKSDIKSMMVKNSKISILMSDVSKQNKKSLAIFADFDDFDYFINDKHDLSTIEFYKEIKNKKVTIIK